jgi:hypothetical protein
MNFEVFTICDKPLTIVNENNMLLLKCDEFLNLIDKIETYTPDIDDIKILDFFISKTTLQKNTIEENREKNYYNC